MVHLKSLRGFSREYLREIYNYKNSLNLKFFEERVWWWRLLDHFKDGFFHGESQLNDWLRRIEKRMKQKDLTSENEDWIYENGKLNNPLTQKERRMWRREKYLMSLLYINEEIGYSKRSVFEYELGSRVEGKYLRGKNWLELGERKKRTDIDIISELKWADPPFLRPSSDFIRPVDQLYDLRKSDYSLKIQFNKWLKIQRKKRGVFYRKPKKQKSNRPLSWKPLEFFDIRSHNLKNQPLSDSERSQLNKAIKRYYPSLNKS